MVVESKSRQIYSLQNRDYEQKQKTKSRIKSIAPKYTSYNKTIKKNTILPKKYTVNTLKNKLISYNNKLIKSKASKLQKKINTKLELFYKDVYNNYLLILFFNSISKYNFADKVKKLSIKLDNYKLTKNDIAKYKKLYTDLRKQFKKQSKTKKKYKALILSKKQPKFKNINSILKGGDDGFNDNGGPYLQRLTKKGNLPITGDDISKTMEEIITILSDLRYLDDAKDAYGPTVLLNYFMGNEEDLKNFLRYRFLPKFVKVNQFPPKIEFGELYSRWDNIVDLLNIYKNDKRIKNEWAVSKGLKPEDVLKPTFIDKLADKIDAADLKFQKFKMLRRGELLRIAG